MRSVNKDVNYGLNDVGPVLRDDSEEALEISGIEM